MAHTSVPGDATAVTVTVTDATATTSETLTVATGSCKANLPCEIPVANPKLWTPETPFLYNMTVTTGTDTVGSYFGMRTVALGDTISNGGTKSLHLNGKAFFASGWLDQSWWPDGQYSE